MMGNDQAQRDENGRWKAEDAAWAAKHRPVSEFAHGDVLRYRAEQYHCREGIACVREDRRAVDTFWGPGGDSQSHILTRDELATAEVMFNVADFDALDRYAGGSRSTWETYHPDDRGRIPSQHGLQEALFVRTGATPDLGTKIANARAEVEEAESNLRSAEYCVEARRDDLARLLAEAEGSA